MLRTGSDYPANAGRVVSLQHANQGGAHVSVLPKPSLSCADAAMVFEMLPNIIFIGSLTYFGQEHASFLSLTGECAFHNSVAPAVTDYLEALRGYKVMLHSIHRLEISLVQTPPASAMAM